jgi:hypothetical protein
VEATNRRGKSIQCRVTMLPLAARADGDRRVKGMIMMMEPVAAGVPAG